MFLRARVWICARAKKRDLHSCIILICFRATIMHSRRLSLIVIDFLYVYISSQVQFYLYYLCPLQKLPLRNVIYTPPPLLCYAPAQTSKCKYSRDYLKPVTDMQACKFLNDKRSIRCVRLESSTAQNWLV